MAGPSAVIGKLNAILGLDAREFSAFMEVAGICKTELDTLARNAAIERNADGKVLTIREIETTPELKARQIAKNREVQTRIRSCFDRLKPSLGTARFNEVIQRAIRIERGRTVTSKVDTEALKNEAKPEVK